MAQTYFQYGKTIRVLNPDLKQLIFLSDVIQHAKAIYSGGVKNHDPNNCIKCSTMKKLIRFVKINP